MTGPVSKLHKMVQRHEPIDAPRTTSPLPAQGWLVLAVVLLLAALMRLPALDRVPPGWRDDELIEIGMDSRISRAGVRCISARPKATSRCSTISTRDARAVRSQHLRLSLLPAAFAWFPLRLLSR